MNGDYTTSPTLSPRNSRDSEDSLRNLEISEGPLATPPSYGRYVSFSLGLGSVLMYCRGRSYSVNGFDFQQDLLPLSSSLTDPELVASESGDKNIGLLNGE